VISRGTVKIHVQDIIGELGVSDRTQATIRAIDLEFVTPESW
jgi:DNA-binding NarL/FixJ family response regulator